MSAKIFFLIPLDCCILMMFLMMFSLFCMCTFNSWTASPLVLSFLAILVFTVLCSYPAQKLPLFFPCWLEL